MAQVEQELNVPVVYVDTANQGEFQRNGKYFKGNSIPFTVLLDSSGKVVSEFSGGMDKSSLVKLLKSKMK